MSSLANPTDLLSHFDRATASPNFEAGELIRSFMFQQNGSDLFFVHDLSHDQMLLLAYALPKLLESIRGYTDKEDDDKASVEDTLQLYEQLPHQNVSNARQILEEMTPSQCNTVHQVLLAIDSD